MLSAQNKEQVSRWSQRQLGASAQKAFISENEDPSFNDDLVEKGGTGISALDMQGCYPLMSVMADRINRVSNAAESHLDVELTPGRPQVEHERPTVHLEEVLVPRGQGGL